MTHSFPVTKVSYSRSSDAYSRMMLNIPKVLEKYASVKEEYTNF